jgi:tetraacyldisaccharide 4'-kinase
MKAPGFWWQKPGAAAALLSPAAAVYGAVAAKRLAMRGERVAVPVICVGNLTVGGSGKTPTAISIARLLMDAREKPMFLTRGYGGSLGGPVSVETQHTAAEVGDEPLLLARVAPTIVSRARPAGARLAQKKGATVVVMDDGFQNPSLAKDLSILVIDGARGIGNGRVLPAGPLRAPLEAQLDRAHALLIVGKVTGASPLVIAARARGLPLFHATLRPDPTAVAALAGTKVLAFAGTADPAKFFATLAEAGIEAPIQRSFADHHRYRAAEAAALLADAERHGLALLTTEKDLARLTGDPSLAALASRARALPVQLTVTEDEALRRFVLGALERSRLTPR